MIKNNSWQKYLSLSTQLIAGLVLTLWIGKKVDEFMQFKQLLIWVLPSLFILFTLYKIIKETQPK
jgi:uncharacterized membrane protein